MSLIPIQPVEDLTPAMQEVAISTYLEHAKSWLSTAVELTGPEQIAGAKAEIATAAEWSRQLHLSKEIQLDAVEMVRRAEYALDRAIRKGQAEGTIAGRGNAGTIGMPGVRGFVSNSSGADQIDRLSPRELFGGSAAARSHAYQMGALSPDEFENVIDAAKDEGDLSRANVVRKAKGTIRQGGNRDQRADLIADLAAQGYSSRQMPEHVGITEKVVRDIARAYGIDIPADKVVGNTRRINSMHVAEQTVTALEGLVIGVELINYDQIDPARASQWADSLTHSLKALTRFRKQIKETTQ